MLRLGKSRGASRRQKWGRQRLETKAYAGENKSASTRSFNMKDCLSLIVLTRVDRDDVAISIIFPLVRPARSPGLLPSQQSRLP